MLPYPQHLLERKPVPLEPQLQDRRQEKQTDENKKLVCRLCSEIITSEQNRISVHGSHIHTHQNPAGIIFTFSCFDAAPGCRICGSPTHEHTWFAGYAWQFAACSGCGEHLGWSFTNSSRFLGLIVERLTEAGETPEH